MRGEQWEVSIRGESPLQLPTPGNPELGGNRDEGED